MILGKLDILINIYKTNLDIKSKIHSSSTGEGRQMETINDRWIRNKMAREGEGDKEKQ